MFRRLLHSAPALFLLLFPLASPFGAELVDIPCDAPQDGIMAGPEESETMHRWAATAFTGQRPPGLQPAVQVEVRRQDLLSRRISEFGIDVYRNGESSLLVRYENAARTKQ